MKRRYFRNHSFKEDRADLIKAFVENKGVDSAVAKAFIFSLYEKGWTLRAISEATKLPIHKIYRIIENQRDEEEISKSKFFYLEDQFPLPQFKTDENSNYIPLRPRSPGIDSSTSRRLRQLSLEARQYRSGMADSSAPAIANAELDALVADLFISYVKIAEIARACGVTPRAIRKRLEKQSL